MNEKKIAHYEILDKLGQGGMGVVYKAHDTKLDRIVALKFLPHGLTSNEGERARFLQEARASAALNHPNVCSVFDIQEAGGEQFIVMEFVEGSTLRKKIESARTGGKSGLPAQEAVTYAIQIGEALQEAHGKNIVHRDVKSENIMVNAKNQIKVMDFGLAKLKGTLKLTRTSSTVGTLAYMAPEQIQGSDVDARSDIFSFGIVVFEMFTGKTPFRGEHDAAMMYSIVNEQPDSVLKHAPDLSPEYDRIISRMLEKDPEDRYQSVADVVSELRREQKKSGRVVRPTEAAPLLAAAESAGVRPAAASIPARKGRALLYGSITGIAALLVAAGIYFFGGRHDSINALAVIPFENVGGGQDLEYVSDGVTESIINNLTRIQGIRVTPRSSAFRFKGKEVDLADIRSKLKVNAILTGKIIHHGTTLDVQVDLIDVDNEAQLWGNHYQVDAGNVLTLQEQISREVSAKLGASLSTEGQNAVVKRYTDNTRAYQLYIQGRYYWNKRTAASIDQAIGCFRQAIALDSTYALAYAGLADCYMIQPQYAGTSLMNALPLARAAAERALAIDGTLVEARTTRAFCLFEEWKFPEAEQEFQKALAMNKRYATTYHWYGIMSGRTGNAAKYRELMQQAIEIDPYSPIIVMNVAVADLYLKHYDEALVYAKKCLAIDSNFAAGHAFMGRIYEGMKQYDDALTHLSKAVDLSGRSSEYLGFIGHCYGVVGRRDDALKILKENEARYNAGTGSAYNCAIIFAGLGDKEKTLEWLQTDFRDHSTWTSNVLIDPEWEFVRSDPRFIAIEKQIGLIP